MRLIDKTKKFFITEKGNLGRKLLKIVLAAPFWVISCALVLLGFGIGRSVYLKDTRLDHTVAEMWQKGSDTGFRHMSVYASGIRAQGDTSPMTYVEGGKSIHRADLSLMRQALQATSNTGAGSNVRFKEGQLRGWEDCYSSTVKTTVSTMKHNKSESERDLTADVELVAVGGNYKAFHPFRYLSGGFLPETPVDTYQIVINDVLAWKFYRSYNVTGNTILIGGQMFTVIGVVEAGTSKVAELAGEQEPRAFIYFGALDTIYGSGSAAAAAPSDPDMIDAGTGPGTGTGSSDYAIQCYEAMLPELVKGVGVSDFKNALPSYSMTKPLVYVSNDTGRFSLARVLDTMFPLGETDKERSGYEFPYWERANQITEVRLFYNYVIIALGIVLLLIGVIMAALKIRAIKAVAPGELDAAETDESMNEEEKEPALKD